MFQRLAGTRTFRIVLSLGLLGGIFFHAGPGAVAAQLGDMDASLVVVAGILLLAESLVRALNWSQLIQGVDGKVGLSSVVYAHFVGGFFGALLPSTLGTDVARSAVVATRSKRPVEAFLATTVLLNLLSLSAISAAAVAAFLLVAGDPATPGRTVALSAAVAGGWLAAVAFAWLRTRHPRETLPADAPAEPGIRGRLKQRFTQFVAALTMLPRGARLVSASFVAVLSYAMRTFGWLALLAAADAQITWLALLTIGPLVTLGAVLPISVLGFGGYQAISVYLLAQWGVPPEQALAASLVQSALAVLLHSLGCIVYITGDRRAPGALGAGDVGQ